MVSSGRTGEEHIYLCNYKLLQWKNHCIPDVFNSLITGLQEANAHLMDHSDERSLDDHG